MEFFSDILNIIDILAIIPFFTDILLVLLAVYDSKHSNYSLILVFRIFRVFRICRVLKLLRHNFSLLALVKTFKYAGADLAYVNVFIFVFGTLFASLEWFVEEKDADNAFLSIPHSLWWAIITMTTVGYGDMSPRSPAGKVVGFMCALVGLLCIALPIPGFIAKFQMLYEYESANLRGRREVNKKLAELQTVANQRMSIIEAKAEDHTRFLIQEYLFNRTNAMDS